MSKFDKGVDLAIFATFLFLLCGCVPINPYQGPIQYRMHTPEQIKKADVVGKVVFICLKDTRCVEPGHPFLVKEVTDSDLIEDNGQVIALSDISWLHFDAVLSESDKLKQNMGRLFIFAPVGH